MVPGYLAIKLGMNSRQFPWLPRFWPAPTSPSEMGLPRLFLQLQCGQLRYARALVVSLCLHVFWASRSSQNPQDLPAYGGAAIRVAPERRAPNPAPPCNKNACLMLRSRNADAIETSKDAPEDQMSIVFPNNDASVVVCGRQAEVVGSPNATFKLLAISLEAGADAVKPHLDEQSAKMFHVLECPGRCSHCAPHLLN